MTNNWENCPKCGALNFKQPCHCWSCQAPLDKDQMVLDLERIKSETKLEVKKMGELTDAIDEAALSEQTEIVSVEVLKGKEIFGDQAKNPNRDMLEITCENDASLVSALPLGASRVDEEGKIVIDDPRKVGRSLSNPNSKIGRLVKKYGDLKKGLKVKTEIDNSGFMQIVL